MQAQTTGDRPTGRVIVLGSVNVDSTAYVDELPRPGETVLARRGEVGLGGKGANQAVAATRLGADVRLLARVGADAAAVFVRERLEAFGLGTSSLSVSTAPTGAAYLTVDGSGENTIAVVSGANADVAVAEMAAGFDRAAAGGGEGVVGLAQGEVPAVMIEAFADRCRTAGIRFVLNLAPVVPVAARVVALADPLIVNEGEADRVARAQGLPAPSHTGAGAGDTAARLVQAGVARSVVITLGAAGAVLADRGGARHRPAPPTAQVVDTSGAGDAFVGAFAALLARGAGLDDAVRWATAMGSRTVLRRGTTASYPDYADVAAAVAAMSDVDGTEGAEAVLR